MKKVFTITLVIVILISLFALGFYSGKAGRYESYQGETTAVVSGVEEQKVYVKTFSYSEYKVSYKYDVDGIEYEGQSGWMVSVPELYEGLEIKVRFDIEEPGFSMLEMDESDSFIWMISICAIALVGAVMIAWGLYLSTPLFSTRP